MDLTRPLHDYTYVAFDTETSGAYPLGSEIVEFAAVKYQGGQIIGEYQVLLKPSRPMSDFIIGIHGITNEMVESAPVMKEKINEILDFLKDSVLMAHHAPFDLGFLAADIEANQLPLPNNPVLCTSLLARTFIKESSNHKLQTLVEFLKIKKGVAHRALDDAKACLEVGIECIRRMGEKNNLQYALSAQGKDLNWQRYSLRGSELLLLLSEAMSKSLDIDLIYDGGSQRKVTRRLTPQGIVRNPDGDYIMGYCHIDKIAKRFYLAKMRDVSLVYA